LILDKFLYLHIFQILVRYYTDYALRKKALFM
jgi:hypothetical protein